MSYEYSPVHGDQISGSPAILSRYITQILAAGAHFQFVDGETIEVLVPGAGESIVTSLGDTVVEAKPAPAPAPAPEAVAVEAAEAVEEVLASEEVQEEAIEAVQEIIEEAVEEAAPAPKPTRGRKPKAATEAVEDN